MRTAFFAVLAIAGFVLAHPGDTIYQIGDGQPQAPGPGGYGSVTPSEAPPVTTPTPVVSVPPVTYTPPEPSTPSVYETTSVPVVTPSSSPESPVTSATPIVSYPVPGNETTPITTGGPITDTYVNPSPSSTEGGGIGTGPSESTPATSYPNAAGMVGVHMGLVAVSVAGLLALLA